MDVTDAPAQLRRPSEFYDAYIFDQDGTIYLGSHLLPGVERTINTLRARGLATRFLSNNPTKDPRQYADKLDALGLTTPLGDIANTVVTTVSWLKKHHPDAVLFPIAEQPLITALVEAGFRISEDADEIDIVIASYDRTFTYAKLQIAFDTLRHNEKAILVQTNPDRYCPFPNGRGEPDCAAITAAIEACTEVKCSVNFGKPSAIMAEEAMRGIDVDPSRVMMVGDRLKTDIAMGKHAGMATALVLTGDSTLDDLARSDPSDRPDFVLEHLDGLIPEDAEELAQ